MGMGNIQSIQRDEWSVFNNVGGLGKVKQKVIVSAFEARPAVAGANRMGAGIILPFSFGTTGIAIHQFGDDLYRESIASAGFGNQFGNTALGVRITYIQYRATGFENHSAVSVDFGGITEITPKIQVGAFITNVTQSTLRNTDHELLPTKLHLGIAFRPDEKILLATELEKDIDFDPTLKMGLDYCIYKKISLRTGYHLSPASLFFGTGYERKNMKIDYALVLPNQIGTSHQVSVSYSIAGKSK